MTIFLRKLERFSNFQSFQNQQKNIFYERKNNQNNHNLFSRTIRFRDHF